MQPNRPRGTLTFSIWLEHTLTQRLQVDHEQRLNEILTSDVQREVNAGTRRRQTESHDDKDGGVRRDAHQHPEHHRQGQGDEKGLVSAQPGEERT